MSARATLALLRRPLPLRPSATVHGRVGQSLFVRHNYSNQNKVDFPLTAATSFLLPLPLC